MASQSAMLEIVPGSDSSDSIVNISRSGASSISSPVNHLPVSATTNSSTTQLQLQEEVQTLRQDKKILEGRIRGYKTLSDLLVECRKENESLKLQLKKVDPKFRTEMSEAAGSAPYPSSPFSLVSNQAHQRWEDVLPAGMTHLSMQEGSHKVPSPSVSDPLTTSARQLTSQDFPVAHPPASGFLSSMQETSGQASAGPLLDQDETQLVSVPTSSTPGWAAARKSGASTPRQESVGGTAPSPQAGNQGNGQEGKEGSADTTGGCGDGSPEALQLDSDKYDEATYQKVGLQLAPGSSHHTPSMYASAPPRGAGPGGQRPSDFPSLESGLSTAALRSPAHSSHSSNPPFMAMLHQELSVSSQDVGLAAQVESMTERLHSQPADSACDIAVQMQHIATRISKMEQKEKDQKKLIDTLMRENQELKRQGKMTMSSHLEETVALREQNARLVQQLKSHPASMSEWVQVEWPSHMKDQPAGSELSLVDRVRKLEQEKAELQRANSNWKGQWDRLEQQHQGQVSELSSKLRLLEQDVSSHRSRLLEQTADFEARMLDTKKRCSEEESLKEEAVHEQRLVERRCAELESRLRETQAQLAEATRQKQALTTELSILKTHTSQQQLQNSAARGLASAAALQAENSMLKEQVKVFAEDFEHEREDRTMAQSARDAAKKDAETLARQNHVLASQLKHLQKQLKDRDDTISWTLRQNEALQRQITDSQKKLAAEWEEKQQLQRLLTQLQRQQQQPQQQRNPYLPQDARALYNTAGPYQPPLPPPSAAGRAPYYPQGAAQPPNPIPPEHLPGAWTCSACTYINYPSRSVCESCGLINSNNRGHPEQYGYSSSDPYASEHALLMSRGNDPNQGAATPSNGDLVIDSGAFQPPL